MKIEHGTASNHYLTALCQHAKNKSININALLRRVGISEKEFYCKSSRIPTEKLAKLQLLIWRKLNDESMGICERPLKVGTYKLMGCLTVPQVLLGDAIYKAVFFYNLIQGYEFISVESRDDFISINVNIRKKENDFNYLFSELVLLTIHRYISWLINDTLHISKIYFNYPKPKHYSEYNYLFPCVHIFEKKELSILFPRFYMNRKVMQDLKSLDSFVNCCPREIFRRYTSDQSLSYEVKLIVKDLIGNLNVSIESVSERMHMTPRTLMRKLKLEGQSFQAIKNSVRKEKAISLLVYHQNSINEIAYLTGFSDQSVFTKTFHRWTGLTPNTYRKQYSISAIDS
ncbi:MAG: AraC family transcriptional regulator ligand-binding domain-containing protein [Vibrio sp.]